MTSTDLQSRARDVAKELLAPLGRRWSHVEAVGQLAGQVSSVFGGDAGTLVAAAYLHDLGYAPALVVSEFHPIDGARAVRAKRFPEAVVSLVAHHSMARVEAALRGLDQQLADQFARPAPELEDALCYCDMVTGPAGQPMTVEDRLDEIQARYGTEHVVTAFVEEARPAIVAAVRRTEMRLDAAGLRVNESPASTRSGSQ